MAATKRKHLRRILATLAVLLVVGIAVIAVAAHVLLNTERVRKLAEAAVAQYTGIDMKIDRLRASLWTGRVTATGLTLAVPEAQATIERVDVHVNLRRLLAREIFIARGDISGLIVRLPEDVDAIDTIIGDVRQTVKEHTKGRGDGPPAVKVTIEEITAAAHVYFDTDTEPFLASDIRIDDLLTSRIGIHADAMLVAWGDAARLYGDVQLLRAEPGSPWQADGGAWLRGVQTEMLPLTNPPTGMFAADMTFMPTDPGPGADIHARLMVPSRPEISGASAVRGVWTGEQFDIAKLDWQSPSAHFDAAGSYASTEDWSVSVTEARATEVSLDALLALFERPRASFEADPGAEVVLAGFAADSIDGDWHVARGDLGFSGITVVSRVENPAQKGIAQATRALRGKASAADGLITIQEIRSDDAHISGTLFPDRANKQLRVDLKGDLNLANLPWTLLKEHGDVQDVGGRLSITKLAGTFAQGNATPDNLIVEGALRDARLKYTDDILAVDAREVAGTFSTKGDAVAVNLRAVDGSRTPVALVGSYAVKDRVWTGTLDTDPSKVVPALLASLKSANDIYKGTAALGPSVFDLLAQFPRAEGEPLTLNVKRAKDESGAALDGTLVFAKKAVTIDATGTAPAHKIVSAFFPRLSGIGPIQATFNYDQAKKTYSVTADATAVALNSESILRKASGTPFTLAMAGAAQKKWTIESVEAQVQGAPAFRFTGAVKNKSVPFEANLKPLAAFLPEGATADGRIHGTLHFDPFAGDFQIDQAALALSPEAALERMQGAIHYTPDVFSCESLEIDGARSDATISLTRIDRRWSGAATGKKLDVESLVELSRAIRTVLTDADTDADIEMAAAAPTPKGSFWDHPITGAFTVDLGEVYYRRGKLDNVSFRILGEDRAVRIPEISARTGEGTILGSIVILPDERTDAIVKSALKWNALDGRAINDMLFPQDRGFYGTMNGELTFDAPLGDYKEMLANGSGSARWSAKQGSVGSAGFAGKLLAALRTTEIIMLKVPSLKDQGLSYKTWTGEIVMTNGVMDLRETQLDGGAYTVTGTGTIDFATEKTNVETFTRVLESVGKVVGSVPIIGDIATAVSTDLVGVPVSIHGSPYDPQASIMGAAGKSVATTPLRAGEGVLKAIGEGLRKLIPGGSKKDNRYESKS